MAQSAPHPDSFRCRRTLDVGGKAYEIFDLQLAERNGLAGLSRLPVSLKVLAENLLRHEDGKTVSADDIRAMVAWLKDRTSEREIAYRPARVLMQDFTGVPAVVDLAAMRDAVVALGGSAQKINPLVPVDLVIDHSVIVDSFGSPLAFARNVELEYERNGERYRFLKWGQSAFDNFRVVPPGTGICHQVNLEYLGQTVWTRAEQIDGETVEFAYPDTLVGTDSHTTMINGLAVLGWGVGGIEAEAAMLGQPLSMLAPEVIGFKLVGAPKEGVTATDLVLERVSPARVTSTMHELGIKGIRLDRLLREILEEIFTALDPRLSGVTTANWQQRVEQNPEMKRVTEDLNELRHAVNQAAHDRDVATPRAMARLLAQLAHGRCASPASCEAICDILGEQQLNGRLPRDLPVFTKLLHKTGTYGGGAVVNDAGILMLQGKPVATIAALSRDVRNPKWETEGILAQVGRAVFDHYADAGDRAR